MSIYYREKQNFIKEFGRCYPQIVIHITFFFIAIFSILKTKYTKKGILIPYQFLIHTLSMLGVTVGIHRYYNHKSFEFKNTVLGNIVKFIMTYFSVQSGNGKIRNWVKAHRTHHRNSDIPKKYDPYDIHYGFWYAHILWLFNNAHLKHPEIAKTDINDLKRDKLLCIFDNNYILIYIISAFVIPIIIGSKILKLDKKQLFMSCIIRQVITWHSVFTINSLAHVLGDGKRPHNKNITPIETTLLSIITTGEGYHNFHHVKCHDYRANNKGHSIREPNLASLVIDFFDWIGILRNKIIDK